MDYYSSLLLANTYSGASPLLLFFVSGFALIIPLAIVILLIVSYWKIFEKAGQKGWKSLIPIYNLIIMLRIIRKPSWWILLMFIPYVNFIVSLIVNYNISKVFGKSTWFFVGMVVLPFIFYPILAFGKSTYNQNSSVVV